MQSSSVVQMGGSAVRVELYASTDGQGVYQSTSISTDGRWTKFSHAYTDGALRSNGTVTPMTPSEYRDLYSFPTIPSLHASSLISSTVHKEIGGYCFTVSEDAETADSYLQGVFGASLYDLYKRCETDAVHYTFHFQKDGQIDRLDIRAEMQLDGQTLSLTTTVRYADLGIAQPIPPT